jgi:hypothetical protein
MPCTLHSGQVAHELVTRNQFVHYVFASARQEWVGGNYRPLAMWFKLGLKFSRWRKWTCFHDNGYHRQRTHRQASLGSRTGGFHGGRHVESLNTVLNWRTLLSNMHVSSLAGWFKKDTPNITLITTDKVWMLPHLTPLVLIEWPMTSFHRWRALMRRHLHNAPTLCQVLGGATRNCQIIDTS